MPSERKDDSGAHRRAAPLAVAADTVRSTTRCVALTLFAALGLSAAAAEIPTDRLIVRLEASKASSNARHALAARLTARGGELMAPHRVMGDGSQVMQLFRRLTQSEAKALAARVAAEPGVAE